MNQQQIICLQCGSSSCCAPPPLSAQPPEGSVAVAAAQNQWWPVQQGSVCVAPPHPHCWYWGRVKDANSTSYIISIKLNESEHILTITAHVKRPQCRRPTSLTCWWLKCLDVFSRDAHHSMISSVWSLANITTPNTLVKYCYLHLLYHLIECFDCRLGLGLGVFFYLNKIWLLCFTYLKNEFPESGINKVSFRCMMTMMMMMMKKMALWTCFWEHSDFTFSA